MTEKSLSRLPNNECLMFATLQPYLTTSPDLKDKDEGEPCGVFSPGDWNLPPAGRPGWPQTAASVSKILFIYQLSVSIFIPVLS